MLQCAVLHAVSSKQAGWTDSSGRPTRIFARLTRLLPTLGMQGRQAGGGSDAGAVFVCELFYLEGRLHDRRSKQAGLVLIDSQVSYLTYTAVD